MKMGLLLSSLLIYLLFFGVKIKTSHFEFWINGMFHKYDKIEKVEEDEKK